MVSKLSKYDKYVDIVDNFLESDHYSMLIEIDGKETVQGLRYRLVQEFGQCDLLIRQRKNYLHIEKMVEYEEL